MSSRKVMKAPNERQGISGLHRPQHARGIWEWLLGTVWR